MTNGRQPESDEAAAIAAACERFVAETTAPAGGEAEVTSPWQRAALVEGVGAKGTIQKHLEGGDRDGSRENHRAGRKLQDVDRRCRQAGAGQAQGTLRNIRAVDIVSTGIRGENLDEYRAHVRVAFLIEGTEID